MQVVKCVLYYAVLIVIGQWLVGQLVGQLVMAWHRLLVEVIKESSVCYIMLS